MRHLFASACVAAAAILIAVTTASATAAGGNLLSNPGFEQPLEGHPWMPAGWDTSEAGMSSVFFGRDTFLVSGGNYAVSIAHVSTLYPMAHNWNQAIVVGREAWGKDAELTVWTRSNGLQGRAFIVLQAYRDTVTKMSRIWKIDREAASLRLNIKKVDDPLFSLGWKREYFSDSETGWVKRTVRVFVPPSVNVLWVRLGLVGTGQVLFDDASLTLQPARPAPAAPLHTNLLADPSFEGDGNAWEYSTPPFENLQVVRDTTVAFEGRASIRMEGGLDAPLKVRTGVGQVLGNRSLAGKRVQLAFRIKTDSLQGIAYALVYAHGVSGSKMKASAQQWSLNHPWESAVVEMDLPPDTYLVWVWLAYDAPAEGRLYYDDCSFQVLGPALKGMRR
jgi:hypothetical protein